jgi:hypothetical protein
MEVSRHDVVGVIAMGDGIVTAVRAVFVRGVVTTAGM